ncbi:DUF1272 domain-containing protein [Cryomorphaceae bacterium 1068]|nr:DUF1272 domain-containing protein [Cryomorphaceae bacterium 1068]
MEIRLNCENCDKPLLNDSTEAMICSFDCTFCQECVEDILQNVCPNCGGGFEKRPTRPRAFLKAHPPSAKKVLKPVRMEVFQTMLVEYENVHPSER